MRTHSRRGTTVTLPLIALLPWMLLKLHVMKPTHTCLQPMATSESPLARRRLGRTGLEISQVGLGGGGLPGCASDAVACDVVAAFLQGGVNFVDTSPSYGAGESERRLGLALADVARSSYVLQTKVGDEGSQNAGHSPFSREGVLASVEHSLKVLGVPHVDSLLLHDPYEDELETFLGKGGGMEAVRQLKSAGIVRHFGCGAREHEPHMRLLAALGPSEFEVAQTVDDENPLRRFLDQLDLRQAMRIADVGLINAAPLYRGLLVDAPTRYHSVDAQAPLSGAHRGVLGEHSSSHVELASLAQAMAEWTRARGVSLTHLAVQWPLASTDVVCSPYGCSEVSQVESILRFAREPLPDGTLAAFEAEFGERVKALGPEKHFYWFKKQGVNTREWREMAVYPRATWSHAFR